MIGRSLAHYEILSLLGEGGMGTVYRAHDTRLGRDVALKVLDPRLLNSDEARARFEREARAVAALSHPNILAIHDFGEHDDVVFAVTEVLEGESLQQRLRQGPLPLRTALDVAAQVADGLAAAHDRGVVHRDLKPANLFLTRDGRAKILDFGLAKATVDPGDDTVLGAATHETTPGTVLGTVRYMAPEQVRGEDTDARSDIFSFGTVLWEMLSGEPAFDRGSAADSMSAILNEDLPDLSASDERVPAFVDRIVQRCTEKSPEQRFRTAHDLGFALRSVSEASTRNATPVDDRQPKRRRVPWVLAAVMLVLGGVVGAAGMRALAPPPPEPVKIQPLTHSGRDSSPAASPDGRTIAFVSDRDGRSRIWLRQMKGGVEAPLTEGNDYDPQFSPDGTSVLFLRAEGASAAAYRIPLVGGAPRRLLDDVAAVRWSPDGETLAALRLAGDAAAPTTIVELHDPRTGTARELARFTSRFVYGLRWSPDGQWLTGSSVSAVLNTADNRIVMIDRDTGEVRTAWSSPLRLSSAAWTPDGRSLVVARSTSLLGDNSSPLGLVKRVDPFSGETESLFWVQSVYGGGADYVRFEFLGDERLVFDEILWRGSLVRVPIDGDDPLARGTQITGGNSRDRQPAFSPDGRTIVFSSNRSGNLDLWTIDTATGELRQVTDDRADDWDPAFSHDGREILWSSNRGGHLEIWAARADGGGARQISSDGVDAENPTQTPDGDWVVYGSGNPERNGIWKMRTDGSEEVRIAAGSLFIPEVSPTGRYVAYIGNDVDESKAMVFVRDLETTELVWSADAPFRGLQDVISAGRPRWMPDESAVLFVSSENSQHYGIVAQDFEPGVDTSDTRRVVVGSDAGIDIESFGVAPDGASIVVARVEHHRTLKVAEDFR